MLKYHKKGVTLTLELQSADELDQLQDGLTNALLFLAEVVDSGGKAGQVIQTITYLLSATRLTPAQQQRVATVLQELRTAA